jgi:hypothetical protein
MYRRIFSIDPSFRTRSLLLLGVVFAFWLAVTIATLLNCRPLKYSWIGLSWEQYCFNYNIFWMVTGVLEVVIDIIILALPVRMVLRLQLSRKRRFSIMLVFLLGGLYVAPITINCLILLLCSIIASDLYLASSSQASSALSTHTSLAAGYLNIAKRNSGQPCTLVWQSSAPVCQPFARSLPAFRLFLSKRRPACDSGTTAHADSTYKAQGMSLVAM